MQRYWSPSTRGFYSSSLHSEIPADAVKITAKRHAALLEAHAAGAEIVAGPKGQPEAVMPTVTHDELLDRARRRVKGEARRRILAIAPLEQQANDSSAIAQAALEIALEGAATIDFAPALDRRRSIDAIRAASDELELELEGLGDAALQAFTPADSPRWP